MAPTPSDRDDDVDLIIDAWSRRLPGVDLTPLDVMSRLTDDGATHVDEAMRELAGREGEALRGLSRDEQATLAGLLRRLVRDGG